jgi:hypothetical protein
LPWRGPRGSFGQVEKDVGFARMVDYELRGQRGVVSVSEIDAIGVVIVAWALTEKQVRVELEMLVRSRPILYARVRFDPGSQVL